MEEVKQEQETVEEKPEKPGKPEKAAEAAAETASGEPAGKSADPPAGEGTDENAAETEKAAEPEKSGEKKKPAKKKPKKDKRDEKIEELNDRLIRNLAEFENFRNRTEKEKSQMYDFGAKSVVEKLLPVVDNLERGFDGLSEEEKGTPFAKGIEAVYKQMLTALDELGVKPIEAVGQEFNPDFHNAVMHDEDDSEETNKVVEEFQKGYMYKDSVVRHSMVKVLN